MKKIILSISLFFLISHIAFAQSFSNSFGLSLSIIQGKNPSTNSYENVFIQKFATYFPRYTLSEKDNSSISIGVPLSAGIGSVDGANGTFFGVDVPLMFDYNMGCNSTPDNEKGFGAFFGLGFGYNYTSVTTPFGNGNLYSYGPEAHAGISFLVSQKDSRPITFGVFYKLGLESDKYRTFGFNLLY
ncbi:MAG: hypothetical protein ABI208_06965 [Ginsengibacter sp.]|jgi:hypothetical protein